MSSTDKTSDEPGLKESYKARIRQYLPQDWGDYMVNDFVDSLFMGLVYDSNSEFGRAISRIRQKWIFKKLHIFDSEHRIIGTKYYPNPSVARTKKYEVEPKPS
jgi:hypothetical protein